MQRDRHQGDRRRAHLSRTWLRLAPHGGNRHLWWAIVPSDHASAVILGLFQFEERIAGLGGVPDFDEDLGPHAGDVGADGDVLRVGLDDPEPTT